VQIAREKRQEEMKIKRQQQEQQEQERIQYSNDTMEDNAIDNSGDEETDDDDDDNDNDDDDDDDDYGPSPAAGIWAGSKRLITESEVLGEQEDGPPDSKRPKTES
jgi:hypothetical protein